MTKVLSVGGGKLDFNVVGKQTICTGNFLRFNYKKLL